MMIVLNYNKSKNNYAWTILKMYSEFFTHSHKSFNIVELFYQPDLTGTIFTILLKRIVKKTKVYFQLD